MSGHDGSIYMLDDVRTPSGFGIWKYSHEDWHEVNGNAFSLAISNSGKPFAIRENGSVFWPQDFCLFPIRIKKPIKYVSKIYERCDSYRRVTWQK